MPKTYLVKEIFGPTLQGEGFHSGKSCVFLRFAACNLACTWCDTDFSADGARKMTALQIAQELKSVDTQHARLVIVTGGEPSLQWDEHLADVLREHGFTVHMESNGTRALAAPVNWLTVSPKPQFHRNESLREDLPVAECKVVVDPTVSLETLDRYEALYSSAQHFFIQPCDDRNYQKSLERAVELAISRPKWQLRLQMHKLIGVR